MEMAPAMMGHAQKWCDKNVPATDVWKFEDLVPALAHALSITVRELQEMVRDEFLNDASFLQVTTKHWVESCNFTKDQLLARYVTMGSMVNGLFVWLATIATRTHLNYVHNDGIWTSHTSENPDIRDAVVLYTEKYFIAAPSVIGKAIKAMVKDGFCEPIDTMDKYEPKAVVLNRPVHQVK